MKLLIRTDPTQACGEVVRKVRVEAANEYSDDDDFYNHLLAELGNDSALEKQMLRVRHEVIGPTPRSRNAFDPVSFIQNIYGDKEDLIVLDSNELDENWRSEINLTNENSEFEWSKVTDRLTDIEETYHQENVIGEPVHDIAEHESEIFEKDLPKRVLVYTSKKLLQRFSQNLKTSIDGTFKSSSKLWSQQFIWLTKSKGFWVPSAFGWLPDKSEESYKVFFLLIIKKMKELGLDIKVQSVLCDFELNILKVCDTMLKVLVCGCFFHFKTCFQRRVDRNGFKVKYERDEKFREFINQASGIAHLPIEDIEIGLDIIKEKFDFEDEATNSFKDDFLRYIRDFWINGAIPPKVWNVFGRSTDLTNNNSEGFNSKFNKELKESHPPPGNFSKISREKSLNNILLVFSKEIIEFKSFV